MLRSAAGELTDSDRHLIDRKRAEKLLRLNSYSPTAITQVNRCKFAFFCKYGLGLREDNIRETGAALTGNVVHYCLEQLLRAPDFISMPEERIIHETEGNIIKYENEAFFEDFGGSKRFSYILKNLSKYAVQAALRMQEEMSGSGFRPIEFEKELELRLGNITVRGRCDRIDGANADGKAYVRVVDYKHSRSLKFDLGEVYKGHNLQMLLYLFGVCSRPDLLDPEAKAFFGNGGAVIVVVHTNFKNFP